MYEATEKQLEAEKKLNKKGFRFANWIGAQDGVENHGCIVMIKRKGPRTEYREIDPEGCIDGVPMESYEW